MKGGREGREGGGRGGREGRREGGREGEREREREMKGDCIHVCVKDHTLSFSNSDRHTLQYSEYVK